ncbi:MAG: diaminopimelate epimerase [Candidatus Eremiobacteraeota bacterium]|nr:diaminopimelate epimerase [Candidatus Eremiobacteraeota bacterium]
MKNIVPLTKMHGTRNDFVLIDQRNARLSNYAEAARYLCDRHAGIGADGLLVVLPSRDDDVRMRIFNPDGSEAQMCGNGIRCLAAYLRDEGAPANVRVETLAGTIFTHCEREADRFVVSVVLPPPQVEPATDIPNVYVVMAGNPNVVIFGDGLHGRNLAASGPDISSKYRDGANVHLVLVAARNRIEVCHWERGAGVTLSCGTGAVAAAAATIYRGDADSPVEVCVPGGILTVEWDGTGPATLTGEAVRVFDATVHYDDALAN